MKSLKKDIFLLFIYSIHNTLSSIWPIIYPYLSSYLIQKNQSLTMKKIFSTTIGMFLGSIIGSIICSRFFFLFGIKKTMQIGGVFLLMNYLLYFYIDSFIGICLNVFLTGIITQMGVLSVNYFLSEKYEGGHLYCNYVFTGTNIANFFWPFICVLFINPNNIGMIYELNGEFYFPEEISKNFPVIMIIIGVFSCLSIFFSTFFLEDPKHMKTNFIPWISALFSNNKRALKKLKTEYKEQSRDSYSKILLSGNNSLITSINFSKNNNSKKESIFENLEENTEERNGLTYEEAEEISKKVIYNKLFISFVFLMALRCCPMLFLVDNYKIIAFEVLKDDKLISLALSLSSLMSIIGQILIAPIWNKFDFFKSHLILYFLLIVTMIIFLIFSEQNSFFMFWICSFNRIVNEMSYGSVYFSNFGLFNPKVGILLTKIIESYKLIAFFIIILVNFLFELQNAFFFITIMNALAMIWFFFKFKNFKEYVKELENL